MLKLFKNWVNLYRKLVYNHADYQKRLETIKHLSNCAIIGIFNTSKHPMFQPNPPSRLIVCQGTCNLKISYDIIFIKIKDLYMEKRMNDGNQNTQQIGQNPLDLPVHDPEKPRINFWMITTLIFGFLILILVAMFMFRLRIDRKTIPIISEPEPTVIPTDINNSRVGDRERYVSVSTCDQWAQYVIDKKNLPRQLIHSCLSTQKSLNSETVYLVDIFYGPPDDCPSGCIYKRFTAVVKSDKSLVEQLPSGPEGLALSVWTQPPLDTIRNYPGFSCPSQLENYINITLGRMGSKTGWNLNFKKPLVCSWEEFDNVKQIVNKKSLTMSGSMFVYLDNGEERWNRDKLVVK